MNKRLVGLDHKSIRFDALLGKAVKDSFHLRHVKGGRCSFPGYVGNDQRHLMIARPHGIIVIAAHFVGRL